MSDKTNQVRRTRQDPHYVNRAVANSTPGATADETGSRVVPAEPPWNQTAPAVEVSDQGDSWIDAAGLRAGDGEGDAGPADEGEAEPATPDQPATDESVTDPGDGFKTEAEVESMSQKELVNYAASVGVSTSGTKRDLIARLRESGKVQP